MIRDKWMFEYSAQELAKVAKEKAEFQQAKISWWRDQKDEVMATIRSEGLEIDEKLVSRSSSMKSRDWLESTRVTVRDDLRRHLDECLKKLSYHTEKLGQYDGWLQILSANGSMPLQLDHSDWLFFFGKPNDADSTTSASEN